MGSDYLIIDDNNMQRQTKSYNIINVNILYIFSFY